MLRTRNIFERRNFEVSELMNADEILLTSATEEILPITSVNGKKIALKIVRENQVEFSKN